MKRMSSNYENAFKEMMAPAQDQNIRCKQFYVLQTQKNNYFYQQITMKNYMQK